MATAQQHPTEVYLGPAPMSVNDVIKLTRAHVGEDVIIQQLRRADKHFVLSSADLIRLKNAGASDRVMQAMISLGGSSVSSTAPVPHEHSGRRASPKRLYLARGGGQRQCGVFAA